MRIVLTFLGVATASVSQYHGPVPTDTNAVSRVRELRRRRVADGLCADCALPREPERNARTRCAACSVKSTARAQAGYSAHPLLPKSPELKHVRSMLRAPLARQLAIQAYGGACACCGEDELDFLTLDHTDGNGDEHRRAVMGGHRTGGLSFYAKMRDLGFPDGLRVLCFNCHSAISYRRSCPHTRLPAVAT